MNNFKLHISWKQLAKWYNITEHLWYYRYCKLKIKVWSRSDPSPTPKVQSTHCLDLDLQNWVQFSSHWPIYLDLSVVRGHSFSLTPLLLSIAPIYIIPQQCLHSSLSTVLTSPLPFLFFLLYSFICFANISIRQTPRWTLPMTPMFIFIFILIFISYVIVSHLYIWGLDFHFTGHP